MELEIALSEFESYLASQQYVAHNTLASYRVDCQQLQSFLKTRQIFDLEQIAQSDLKLFLHFLKKDLKLKSTSMSRKISTLKHFFSFAHQTYRTPDLGEQLIFPHLERKLPNYLTEQKMKRLFGRAEKDQSRKGKRNFMMLHLIYVTGMRVTELVSLKIPQLRLDMGLVTIFGKGSKERLVPLPAYTVELLSEYFKTARPALLTDGKKTLQSDLVFPLLYGKRIKAVTRQSFWKYVKRLDPTHPKLSPHVLRHSLATHLLHKGVDLRSLQMILGHEHLTTVEIYTHIEMSHLRTAYNKKHPRS